MGNKPSKLIHRFFFRRFMDSIDEWKSFFLHPMGNGLVGSDHKFFDDLMGQISLRPDDVLRLPLEIEDDLGLRKIEIKGASFRSSSAKFLAEIGHQF